MYNQKEMQARADEFTKALSAESSPITKDSTQTAHSKLKALGFQEEPNNGHPSMAIIGGVHRPQLSQ